MIKHLTKSADGKKDYFGPWLEETQPIAVVSQVFPLLLEAKAQDARTVYAKPA